MQTDLSISVSELLEKRIEELKNWLAATAPQIATEQKHLDEGTPERAYWHYGYLAALQDAARLLSTDNQPKM